MLDYQIIRSKKLSSRINLTIKNGQVLVKAPFWVPKFTIDNFVNSKVDWIKKTLQRSFQKLEVKKQYVEGEKHLLFGNEHILKLIYSPIIIRTFVSLEEEYLLVNVSSAHSPENQKREIEDALLRYYLEKIVDYLTDRANYYCLQLDVDYSKIDVKKVSSIWGSCSAGNALSFNRKLAMAPKEVVDYVVIHEVAHLRERNHSSRFWGLVFKFDRDYKKHRQWLRGNHELLTI